MPAPSSFEPTREPREAAPIYVQIGGLTAAVTAAGVPLELVVQIIAAVSPLPDDIISNPVTERPFTNKGAR
ncbi:hypothetical protein [Nocardia sp. NPDC050793]|uniref:hypothetical protein n=1 Tax=Nocardia sp. NPDC050793 TaxID=3155159 RepID=UPI0033C075DB